MPSRLVAIVFVLITPVALLAQERGKIKKVDADKGTVTITVDGKDQDFVVSGDTKFMGKNGPLEDGLKNAAFKEGTEVMFKYETDGDKKVLRGIRVGGTGDKPGGDFSRGKIKKIDLDKMTVTITSGGKDLDFTITDDTQVIGVKGDSLKEKLKEFKEGTDVGFVPAKKDGKDVLQAIGIPPGGGGDKPKIDKVDTSKLKALSELGKDEYQGYKGGLYPDGTNERPKDHEAAGLALAKKVQPLNADGKPDPKGKIVLLTVGMSNTSQASQGFADQLAGDKDVNPLVKLVNGAQGGMTAQAIADPDDKGRGTQYWSEVDNRLKKADVTREQVQVIWIKQADAGPNQGFPKYAEKLESELQMIVQILPKRFPNVKLCYLSSRTYGGFASTPLNPEPYAYESGFSVKWLIEKQIKGDKALSYDSTSGAAKSPWLSWGPYLWANGATKNSEGLSFDEKDFSSGDGTHESPSGQEKVGKQLLKFFKNDSTTKSWFLKQ